MHYIGEIKYLNYWILDQHCNCFSYSTVNDETEVGSGGDGPQQAASSVLTACSTQPKPKRGATDGLVSDAPVSVCLGLSRVPLGR